MQNKKPTLELIQPSFGSSFSLMTYDKNKNDNARNWHFHPEVELVYINGGSGKRQIGSHISYFTDGDLIMIGSNLPHCGFTDKYTGNKNETVVQLPPDFLGEDLINRPEMKNIRYLFERSKSGLAFTGVTKRKVGEKIQLLQQKPGFERFIGILEILNTLQLSEEYQILNAGGFHIQAEIQDNDRINTIFNHVRTNFKESISLDEISDIAGMTVPSFCRYFKKMTGKTFTNFVNEYRLVHASTLLAEKPMSITEICYESGFNNFSHFNKSFKAFTGKSPSAYRNEFKKVISNSENQ
ncbi:AraC family transcriptional regulator [Robertkochia aurantiaca]|uniref:AraC family transcriptional regulator n=1 Tax=Robertkochia aurantiaca TaxID=2873700 RepID=UPI001CCE9271|nr:AraC family transcriptional regulator [Robertkochia sp. 3YJGBD-33]